MKKTLSFLLAVLLLSLLTVSAAAAGTPGFVVSSASAAPGEEVTLTVSLENNPGIASFEYSVVYDEAVLEWTGVTKGSLTGNWDVGVGEAVTWIDADNHSDNGVVTTLVFTVKPNAPAGNTTVTVEYDPDNVFDENADNVEFAVVPGVVMVTGSGGGDEPAEQPSFVVSSGSAAPGEEVTLTVSLANNPGIASFEYSVVYDDSVLEWTGVTKGSLAGNWDVGVGEAVTWIDADNHTDNGVVTTLVFTVKPGAVAQDTTVSIEYDPDNVFDENADNVAFAVVPGTVTITGGSVEPPAAYTVTYDPNGGVGAPEAQTKTEGTALTLSSDTPTRANTSVASYTVTLNANGGSVSQTSLTAARTTSYSFKNWNTAQNGSGTSYAPGASYTADEAVTLYAQWDSSMSTGAVTLPTPTREGYTFQGWATSSTAASGVTGSYTPTGDVILFAVWQPVPTDAPVLTASSATARPKESVTLTVSLERNPGLKGISTELIYDESALTLVSATPLIDQGTWMIDSIADDHLIYWYSTDAFTGGELVTLSFTVNADAPEGDFEVGFRFGDWDSLVDASGEEIVLFSTVPGVVTVTHRVPGDINGDSRVNLSDVIRLAEYVKARGVGVTIVTDSGDTNGDGRVNLSDVIRLAEYVKARGVGVELH